jgi:hypothetical protein
MKTVSNMLRRVGLVCSLATACGCVAVAQNAKQPAPKKATASITITLVPSAGPGETSFGDIAGTVKNAPPDSKVVIWSLGETWYVQPYADAPFTNIGKDSKWSATVHGGYAFAAALVLPGYAPPTTGNLPEVGGKILAITHITRKK